MLAAAGCCLVLAGAAQTAGAAGDCSVGGNVQYGTGYETDPAAVSAYVAEYTP